MTSISASQQQPTSNHSETSHNASQELESFAGSRSLGFNPNNVTAPLNNYRDAGRFVNLLSMHEPLQTGSLLRSGNLNAVAKLEEMGNPRLVVNLTQDLRKLPPSDSGQSVDLLHFPKPDNQDVYNLKSRVNQKWLVEVLQSVAQFEPSGPVWIHCNAGKDRTGVVIAALLKACGIEDELICEEYSLSQGKLYSNEFKTALGQMDAVIKQLSDEEVATLKERFLYSGKDQDDNVQRLRGLLLDPSPLLPRMKISVEEWTWTMDSQGRPQSVEGELTRDQLNLLPSSNTSPQGEHLLKDVNTGQQRVLVPLLGGRLGGRLKSYNLIPINRFALNDYKQSNKNLLQWISTLPDNETIKIKRVVTYAQDSTLSAGMLPTTITTHYSTQTSLDSDHDTSVVDSIYA